MEKIERRKNPRFLFDMQCKIELLGTELVSLCGKIKDISIGGLCVVVDTMVDGISRDIRISFENQEATLALDGCVYATDQCSGDKYTYYVKFKNEETKLENIFAGLEAK